MRRFKAKDLIPAIFAAVFEGFTCVGLTRLFFKESPVKYIVLILLVLFVWNFIIQIVNKPEEIKKAGKVIVNVEDPDKELLAIKLMIGEYELITSDVIAFDVERES